MSNLENNPVLNKYYADMNNREEDARIEDRMATREAEMRTDRAATVEAIDYAYEQAKCGQAVSINEAFAAIAEHFYSMGNSYEDKDGVLQSYNNLLFQQRGVLGNLCQNAKWMLDNATKHLVDLNTKLDQQEATMDDSEIALRNITMTLDQIERAEVEQIPACEDWFENCQAAYEAIIGEPWKPFTKQGKTAKEQTADAVKARLAARRS